MLKTSIRFEMELNPFTVDAAAPLTSSRLINQRHYFSIICNFYNSIKQESDHPSGQFFICQGLHFVWFLSTEGIRATVWDNMGSDRQYRGVNVSHYRVNVSLQQTREQQARLSLINLAYNVGV